ncbi:MAG TPA: cytochrome C oxidase subunit IV family protein [Burkholderiaceae bacterium]|nr:cytochrome C oxidase subunit IV family protein [Burkholderiaceae bacterium]
MMANHDTQVVEPAADERQELFTYITGLIAALILTLAAFALIHYWPSLPQHTLFMAIGALALLQAAVHFRFFLHIGTKHSGDEFKVLLFTILMLIVMVGGTLWVMSNLAMRMMPHF